MSATRTLDEGLAYLRFLLTAVEGGHWQETELKNYLNTAQKEVSLKLSEELLRDLVSTYENNNIDGITEIQHPPRYARFIGGYREFLFGSSIRALRKRPLIKVSYNEILFIENNIINQSEMQYSAYIADLGKQFWIFPRGMPGEYIQIKYAMLPTIMVNSNDKFSVDDLVWELVIYYAAFLACVKDKQANASSFLSIYDKHRMELEMKYNPNFAKLLQLQQQQQ